MIADKERVHELLEEMLESQRTPEDVCVEDPELLREVRNRWERMQRIGGQIDALFPADPPTRREQITLLNPDMELPQIAGYDVQAVLGRGGMGVVFKARHRKLNRIVAVKMLLAGAYAGVQELARFRREAEAVAALRHPTIVQIHDAGEITGRPYFTMEYVEKGSLAQNLARRPQAARRAAELVATLACAVQFAHQSGFIHRDLKPANILLTADGAPKITDFGLARSIHAGPEFTLTGARIGTPSYMAPEQAMGKTSAIGPAVDIYALGAVLYEMLTGRPPFEGESAVETEQKVVAEEPVAPARLNPKVPRDLETICLKCLQKNPARRYASAQDLADDLHRFLDGKPVVARPIGLVERSVKWARRRPALATLSCAVAVLLAASIGLFTWMRQEEATRQAEKTQREARARADETARQAEKARGEDRARQAVEAAIANAYESAQASRWHDAERFLDGADNRLADANSAELRLRIDQAKKDVAFAQCLVSTRSVAVVSTADHFFVMVSSYEAFAELYAKTFAEAKFDIDGDPEVIAARIRSAPLGAHTVAALDEWALAAFMLERAPLQKQLLRITRLADPDPFWRDRLRDPGLWRDKKALARLADDSLTVAKPPASHHLTMTGALLRNVGEKAEETRLMRNALLRRRGDAWLNWELAKIHTRNRKYADAATYLRVAIALHKSHIWIENHLGTALCLAGDFEEGIIHLRLALALDPDRDTNGMIRHNLAQALAANGQFAEAHALCRRAIDALPNDPWAYHTLGILLNREDRPHDAIPMLQKAAELKPGDKGAHWNLGSALGWVGRHEEALASFRNLIALKPSSVEAHQAAAHSLLLLGRHREAAVECAWILRELDPAKQADAYPTRCLDARYVQARLDQVETLLGLGQFARTDAEAQRVLELRELDKAQRSAVERCREVARRLAPLEPKLTALLIGAEKPADVATQRTLAEWLYKSKRHTVAAARLYEEMLTKTPPDKLEAQDRLHAVCAAALAGSGVGNDAGDLGAAAKTAWRNQALAWLQAERQRIGANATKFLAARAAHDWLKHGDLDVVRAESALARLPAAEREGWRKLWANVTALASGDPGVVLANARAHIDRKQWAKAAEAYARFLKDTQLLEGEVWFEYAAAQLLAGDHSAYRQTCEQMLEAARDGKMRSYLAARACTLAPDSVDDLKAPTDASATELNSFRTQFWSLTEQGALLCRANQGDRAVALFEQSLQVEPRPGVAVVNWLWLSLAHHKLGDNSEARRQLTRASVWLDRLGNEMPAGAGSLGLHRHNWLEAQVLRREAESLLMPKSTK